METLHIRAENSTIEMLMSLINDMSKDGKEIEIIDDISYEKEYRMIKTGLQEIKKGEVIEHDELWSELLGK
ncbi:hypothetical protein [Hydrogenimonas thermophila]|uniref:Uncharacterized protein n=1 Tax=Hydrogenimonas thermophila TaxID=223786 RepID=A0A1I5U1G5_9BACT|nr:hypothetical protein [Hydrogenimonas thermophila]WOE69045.1 hypothetical protein RZR91_07985 [Hydrogenimonas thermophila]WOE71555.1 hypothetical protein RZR97_07960 [Hydrogenimonas thermophila]SFP89152.1 hypothetical protein SAMN05216234_1534 [Hydrogenimonas thermophila]